MIDLQKIRSIRQQITSDVELKNDIRKLVSRILLLSIGELQAENGSIFLIEDNMITFEILAYESSFSKDYPVGLIRTGRAHFVLIL